MMGSGHLFVSSSSEQDGKGVAVLAESGIFYYHDNTTKVVVNGCEKIFANHA